MPCPALLCAVNLSSRCSYYGVKPCIVIMDAWTPGRLDANHARIIIMDAWTQTAHHEHFRRLHSESEVEFG